MQPPRRCASCRRSSRPCCSGDLWKRPAAHANLMAQRLADAVSGVPGVTITQPVQANAVFAIVPAGAAARLRERFFFYDWASAPARCGGCARGTRPARRSTRSRRPSPRRSPRLSDMGDRQPNCRRRCARRSPSTSTACSSARARLPPRGPRARLRRELPQDKVGFWRWVVGAIGIGTYQRRPLGRRALRAARRAPDGGRTAAGRTRA